MTDYMVQKGEEGENYVNDIINQVLPKMDYTYIIVRNKIFPFESVYGRFGYISAEFDFVVFTPYYIFIIEVKN
ncbi:NERD domain-containing protein, partial [bacterium]|nr:NERD domain-containing protein [bacterium]